MPNGSTPELILQEARDKRSKQDSQLQALLRMATGALIVVLSAGTIAPHRGRPPLPCRPRALPSSGSPTRPVTDWAS